MVKFDFRRVTQDEREQLYEEVWSSPISEIAKKYEVSDTTIRKHLKRLRIPIPSRQYWTKLNKGEPVQKTVLPGVTRELSKYVRNYVIKYRRDLDQMNEEELSSSEDLHLLREESKRFIKDKRSNIEVKKRLLNPHPLISNHKEEIKYRKKRDRELNTEYGKIMPPKDLRENDATLPIDVSSQSLNRAYRILDALIKTIESMEGSTQVSIKDGKDRASFWLMYAVFDFEIKEKNNKLMLIIQPTNWMSFSNNNSEKKIIYKDEKDSPLEDQVGDILYTLFVIGNRLFANYKIEEIVQNREWEEEKRKRKLEELRKGELSEIEELTNAVEDWNKANKIRQFVSEIEVMVNQFDDVEQKNRLLKWVNWARSKADWLDPLMSKEDEILGESQTLFQQILKNGDHQ